MSKIDDTAATPAIAFYQEWLGNSSTVQDHTRANAKTSMAAQNADVNRVAQSIHFHKGEGFWLFVSAPVNPAHRTLTRKGD